MAQSKLSIVRSTGKLESFDVLPEALAALPSGGYLWLDYSDPQEADLHPLIEALKVHPLSIEDCVDNDQIPKLDLLAEYTFVLFNTFHWDQGVIVVDEIDLMIGKNFVVTVHPGELNGLFDGRLQRLAETDTVRAGPDMLAHAVLDQVVDGKLLAIEELQDGVELAEERILKDPASFKPEELMVLRRQVLAVRKSLMHERELLSRICRRDSTFVSERAIFSFRDVYDHTSRYLEITEMCREMISSDMEMYLSIINNRMTMTANRTNRVMRRLTFITTIFMPLTLLAGVGGMSEWSMMTGQENWRVSYPLFLLIMVVVGVVNWYVLRWLDRRDEAAARHSGEEVRNELIGAPESVRSGPRTTRA
jgi:magnesium transporter